MVDGVGNGANPHNILKLKGKNGQTIDLKNLEGLQETDQNKALFTRYDTNKNGIIDKNEVIAMQNNLQSIAQNNTISKRELNKHFGKDSNAMEALSKLASQQEAFQNSSNYKEVNGNTTTHVYKGFDNAHSFTYKEIKDKDFVTTELDDGSKTIQHKNGSRMEISKDGVQTLYNNKGQIFLITNPDGSTIEHTPDGNKSITRNPDGQTTRIIELKNQHESRTDFEYTDDKTVARTYNGTGTDAPLSSITVSEKQNGHNVDTKYATEEDMTNSRPSEQITDAQNPTLKTVTKFTYDENGNIKAETTNSAGETTTKFTNAKGENINETEFNSKDTAQTYIVPKGHTITQIAKDILIQQGIENPTPEQIKDARKQIIEANSDQIKTMQTGDNKGYKYFYADAEIKVPQLNLQDNSEKEIDGGTLPEVVVTAPKITPEMKAKRQELQAQLGSDYEVGYTTDGNIEVRDKFGNVLEYATIKAIQETNDGKTALTDLVLEKADQDTSETLDKTEFKNFILQTLELEITDANRDVLEKIIETNFNSLDNINTDSTISKEELNKNLKNVLKNIGNQINEMEEN